VIRNIGLCPLFIKLRHKREGTQMANPKRIELKTFSSGIALVLACRLLNARHFAEEEA